MFRCLVLALAVFCLPYSLAQDGSLLEEGLALSRNSPLDSTSDDIGGLRNYGPVEINDVTGKVRVQLPQIGPSPLLSIAPLVRTQLDDDHVYLGEDSHLDDNFYAMGIGGSIGFGHFWVTNPEEEYLAQNARQMTYYEHGDGSPVPFMRDYLYQSHHQVGSELFSFQHTIDRNLRRMIWQAPGEGEPAFLGDYLLLNPSGRKITFSRRKWNAPINDSIERLYYPIRVEDPNGEWIEIHYHVDSVGNQLAMMEYMEDNHGRKLHFVYDGPVIKGHLKEVRLLKPTETVGTHEGLLLAQFTYQENGLVVGEENLKSLHTMTDAYGYTWTLNWGQDPAYTLEEVNTPTHGSIKLNWEIKSILKGRYRGEQDVSSVSWRVTRVDMIDAASTRSYAYNYETLSPQSDVFYSRLQVSITGPEGLVQKTQYENMPSIPVHLLSEEIDVVTPESGQPLYRYTFYNGSSFEEEWSYEPVYLWSTGFQPPHQGIMGNAAGNSIQWSVRPKKYSIRRDGQWYDTEYVYEFNHADTNIFTGTPNQSIVSPTLYRQSVRGGNIVIERRFEYEQRVTYNTECHTYPGDTYIRALPTLAEDSYIMHYGESNEVDTLMSKTTYVYHHDLPFPTKQRDWYTHTDFLETNFTYHTTGANKGKLASQYVGNNANHGVSFPSYSFGLPNIERTPLLPDVVHEIDFRGNVGASTAQGIRREYTYDLADRVTRTEQPEMVDLVSEYSSPTSFEMSVETYLDDATGQKRWQRAEMDEWARPISTEKNISGSSTGLRDIQYDGLGHAEKVIGPFSSKVHSYDVVGRPRSITQLSPDETTVLEAQNYTYTSLSDGRTKTEEKLERNGEETIKEVINDFAGRVVETSFNRGKQGSGSGLNSNDYAGGSHTTFSYNQDGDGLITTTINPYGITLANPRTEVRDLLGRLVEVTDPEYGGGSIRYTYNNRGLLEFSTMPDGRKYQYIYDDAGRILEQRARTGVDQNGVETYAQVLVRNAYHPEHGYLETQVRKIEGADTRVESKAFNPDGLGRPTEHSLKVGEPRHWNADLLRASSINNSGEEIWHHQWRSLSGVGMVGEYVFELKPLEEERVSLYFPGIRLTNESDEFVSFDLGNSAVFDAIDAQLVGHTDRAHWLADAQAGSQSMTVLDPEKRYRFRVTGIDGNFQATLPTYWWGDLPDLFVDDIDLELSGSTLTLDFRIFNGGSQTANASTTHVYLSETADLATDATPAISFNTPSIAPGFAGLHSAPQLNASGAAYVIIVIDADLEIVELDEQNNLGREFIAYIGSPTSTKPDVIIEEMDYAHIVIGNVYQTYATYAVQNQSTSLATSEDGTASTGHSLTRLYFSADNIISNDDTLLAEVTCDPLNPMAREIQTTSLGTFNEPVPLHMRHLIAAANSGVDDEPLFDEGTNSFNNVATVELPQQPGLGPDLSISSFVHQGVSGFENNLTMDVAFYVYNDSVFPASSSHVGFFYSVDDQWDANDQRLFTTDGEDSVAIGHVQPGWNERVYGQTTLSVPANEGYLILYADVANEVVERNEVHNWKSQDFAGYADLTVQSFSYNASTGQYTITVKNEGNLPSQATQVGAYLSFHETGEPNEAVHSEILFSVPSLGAGWTSEPMKTPIGWEPPSSNEDTWLFFAIDPGDVVHESDEFNNATTPQWIAGTGQGNAKPDLIPDQWGFTASIWPATQVLTAPDVEVSELQATNGTGFVWWRIRGKAGESPIEAHVEGLFSDDAQFGNADDINWLDQNITITNSFDSYYLQYLYNAKDHVRIKVTTNTAESSALNNTAYTRFSLPDRMAVHAVTNQSNVSCGPSTTAVYMSQDNNPVVSPNDDLISLYIHPGFNLGGTDPGHMIAYDSDFMDTFSPLDGWYLKFVVDATDAINESDETNNVLVVDANPDNYQGPLMPAGLPPLPNPGPGTFTSSLTSPGTQAVHQVSLSSVSGTGLVDIAFRLQNQNDQAFPIDNLSIFAASDFGLDKDAKLVFSSMLAGDAQGEKRFPSSIPSFGSTNLTQYRLRIPDALAESPYKLIFVANGEKVIDTSDGNLDPHPYIYFDRPETRIIGIVEPNNGGL